MMTHRKTALGCSHWCLVLATAIHALGLVAIWRPVIRQNRQATYRRFARALGVSRKQRYLFAAHEYLVHKIPLDTTLEEARKRVPPEYVLADEEVFSIEGDPADWQILLGPAWDGGQPPEERCVELHFCEWPPGRRALTCVHARTAPVWYSPIEVTICRSAVCLSLFAVAFLLRGRRAAERAEHDSETAHDA
jgi:hypothetical protein